MASGETQADMVHLVLKRSVHALELLEKQKAYAIELRRHWQALKASRVRSVACEMLVPAPMPQIMSGQRASLASAAGGRKMRVPRPRLRCVFAHAGVETGNGRGLKKDRWDDNLLFLAQDVCIREQLRTNRSVQRLFTMGFVKVRLPAAGHLSACCICDASVASGLRGLTRVPCVCPFCADHLQPQWRLCQGLG